MTSFGYSCFFNIAASLDICKRAYHAYIARVTRHTVRASLEGVHYFVQAHPAYVCVRVRVYVCVWIADCSDWTDWRSEERR